MLFFVLLKIDFSVSVVVMQAPSFPIGPTFRKFPAQAPSELPIRY